jgi:hypothetical protein
MTIDELKSFYINGNQFEIRTNMTANSFRNWVKQGYIPFGSQYHIELLTHGELKASREHARAARAK